jgi:hypothetical protein
MAAIEGPALHLGGIHGVSDVKDHDAGQPRSGPCHCPPLPQIIDLTCLKPGLVACTL